jgi:hypothetical protein
MYPAKQPATVMPGKRQSEKSGFRGRPVKMPEPNPVVHSIFFYKPIFAALLSFLPALSIQIVGGIKLNFNGVGKSGQKLGLNG